MLKIVLVAIFRSLGLEGTRAGNLLRKLARGFTAPPVPSKPDAGIPGNGPDTADILVAFKIGGGIGDHLLAARYIRDLIASAGEFRFDIYSSRPEVSAFAFGHMSQFNRCYDEYFSWHAKQYFKLYPLAMWVSQFVVLQYETVNWLKLNTERPKLVRVCETIDRFRHSRDLNEIIVAHPRLDNLLGLKAVFLNLSRMDFAHAMSGISYGGDRLGIPVDAATHEKFGLAGRRYVTIHNGFDAEFQTVYGFASRSTKVYELFDAVVTGLRDHRPDLVIVQLGTKTSRAIKGVDLQLLNQTSLAETASLLAGSALHIDNESGLVHLAACVGTRSCVAFGPTPVHYFGYSQNVNIAPTECGGCWWVTKDWMTNCPRGFDKPICLSKTLPETVVNGVLSILEDIDHARQITDLSPPGANPSGETLVPSLT
jgi:hypothetical protein